MNNVSFITKSVSVINVEYLVNQIVERTLTEHNDGVDFNSFTKFSYILQVFEDIQFNLQCSMTNRQEKS